ncbi:MAG: M20 family metallopeptidase [Acidobacteriota bacterium]
MKLKALIREELPAACSFLLGLIRFPSLSGRESEVMEYLAEGFGPFTEAVEKVPFPTDFPQDPEYSFPVTGLSYAGRYNLRITAGGSAGLPVLFNTHTDVVPASSGQKAAFEPRVDGTVVYGRGACDAKGQIATLYLLLRVLRRLGGSLPPIVLHLVTEEEVGGNGTLAMVRRGEKAGAAVVLEPTGNRMVTSVRGALWFRLSCAGQAGHSGSAGGSVSALKNCVEAMGLLERYHARLLSQSRGFPLFDRFENPMPLTFGRLTAGNWPAAAPDHACLEGVLGFLPNKNRREVMEELEAYLEENGSAALRNSFLLEYTYRHDCHVLPPDHPLVLLLQRACVRSGQTEEVAAFPASCDSWYYHNLLGIPTLVYGPGHLRFAHSAEEQIDLEEVAAAAEVLARFASSAEP